MDMTTTNHDEQITAWAAREARNEIVRQVQREYPDVYFHAGLGWCGPDFDRATQREAELLAEAGLA